MTAATDAAAAFPIGARVRVRKECAESYLQPWRKRFQRGYTGTVIPSGHRDPSRVAVQWNTKRGKSPGPSWWTLTHPPQDLELVGDDA